MIQLCDLQTLSKLSQFPQWRSQFETLLEEKTEWAPRCEINEVGDQLFVDLELAGVKKSDIQIETQDDKIIIKGEKKRNVFSHSKSNGELENEGKTFSKFSERTYGKFERDIRVSKSFNLSEANATFENGVLTLVLNRSEAAKPKNIVIKSNE